MVPLARLPALRLWRRLPWDYVLSGIVLVKGVTMGLALLSMEWFAVRSGRPTDGLEILWAMIAFGGLGTSV